jgi:uncharacterized membrane protein
MQDGQVKTEDLVWNEAMGEKWLKAGDMEELRDNTPGTAAKPEATGGRMPNGQITAHARAALKGNWGTAIAVSVIYMLITMAIGFIPFLNGIVSLLVTGPFMLGLALFFLDLSRGRPTQIGRLFEGFQQFGRALGAYLLMILFIFLWAIPFIIGMVAMVLTGAQTAASQTAPQLPAWGVPVLFLLYIPVIVAMLRYSMVFYALADNPVCGAMESIRRSTLMMKGNKAKLFLLGLRFIGWGILCMLTLGIGFLWLMPYVSTSIARFYDDVAESGDTETA